VLRTLSLRLNALSGGIPDDIGSCAELRYLYLQGNRLDGQIPEGFFQLRLLQRLDLSNNRIAGGVSPDFNRLQRLATLYLENNSLNGTLPSNLDLPKLQLFNVSRNNLTGPHVSRNSLASLLSRSPWRAWTRRLSMAGRGLGWLAIMYS